MTSQHVWALLGLLCLLIMFAMMAAGARATADEDLGLEPEVTPEPSRKEPLA